eukprot:6208287-Pleurochrysis_carterae.AAC.1
MIAGVLYKLELPAVAHLLADVGNGNFTKFHEKMQTTTTSTTSLYGAEPHMNHDLHICGKRHHVKHSCRSDALDRVARDVPYAPHSA